MQSFSPPEPAPAPCLIGVILSRSHSSPQSFITSIPLSLSPLSSFPTYMAIFPRPGFSFQSLVLSILSLPHSAACSSLFHAVVLASFSLTFPSPSSTQPVPICSLALYVLPNEPVSLWQQGTSSYRHSLLKPMTLVFLFYND